RRASSGSSSWEPSASRPAGDESRPRGPPRSAVQPEPVADQGVAASRGRPATRQGDQLLLGILLVLLAAATTLSPIRNYDYWWHLKTGALIVSQGQVPRVDPYSFTSPGTPWIDHE